MGDVVRLNRHKRRAHAVARRREDRAEVNHRCAIDADLARRGVWGEVKVRLAPEAYHCLHIEFGEPSCPRCPRCIELRRAGRIERPRLARAFVLALWEQAVREARR